MKIEEMPAGRELDAFVAEKVMGWKYVDHNEAYDLPISGVAFGKGSPDGLSRCPVPYYSTDIAAAWEVVEKLRKDGFAFDSYSSGSEEAEHPWTDAIFMKDNNECLVRAETMPLAICRAASMAVL